MFSFVYNQKSKTRHLQTTGVAFVIFADESSYNKAMYECNPPLVKRLCNKNSQPNRDWKEFRLSIDCVTVERQLTMLLLMQHLSDSTESIVWSRAD